MVSRIYTSPVNYQGADGSWHAIDNTLVASPLGGHENAANSFSLRLPESLSSGVSLDYQGRSLSFSLDGTSTSLPAISGATATYQGVLPSTDVSYVSEATGVREIATLKDASAPTQLRYTLSLPAGLSPRQAADGSITLVDGRGAVLFTIPAPMAYRPSAGPISGRRLPTSLISTGSGSVITVDTGEAWLREELSTGAVAIDPTVTVSASQACSLSAEAPKTSSCSSSELRVGYDSTHQENHGLLQFNLSSLPLAPVVLNAKLGLYVQGHSTSTAKAVGVYRVTKPWTTAASWETYDGTHAWSAAGGDYANPETHSDASVNPSVGGTTGWSYWYPTRMVQEWLNTPNAPEGEGFANEGLIVKDQTDNATANLLTVSSPSAASNKPFLEISYQARGQGSQGQYTQLGNQMSDSSTMSVNVASGNLMLQNAQLHTAGVAGFGYTGARTWNGLNGEKSSYGHWGDSNGSSFLVYGDGSVSVKSSSGGWFEFQKQASGSFITPPGIKATMCAAGTPAPCPPTLPSGVSYQLLFNGSQERVNFNASGGGVSRQDRHGNTLARTFPAEHRTLYTDPQGHKIEQVSEGPESYTSEIKDISGSRNVKFTYETFSEGEPELASATDAHGNTTKYTYSNYEIASITDPKGNVTKLAYDAKRRLTEIIRTTNAEHTTGPTTQFQYYDVGKGPSPCTATQMATVVIDPDGVRERAEKKAESETSHTTRYCSTVLDQVERVVDAAGHETKATFDPFGNQISSTATAHETGGTPGVTSFVYGEAGQNLNCEVQGPAEEPTKECPTGALSKGYSNRYAYKDTAFVFQPTETMSARQQTTALCYWGGSAKCTGEETGTNTTGDLKQLNSPLATQNTLKYTYNSNGTVSSSTDPDGHTTTYEYDLSGNLKTITPPSGSSLGKQTITVDSVSRPHTIVQCLVESGGSCTSSQTETLTYDAVDRVIEAVDTGPGATKTFKYTYDSDGNVEKRVDPTGTTTFTVDPLNRVTEEALPGALSNAYAYDEASNLTSFTDAGGTSHYFYNQLNQLESMYEPGGTCSGTPSKCTRAVYDNAGSLATVTYPSGATLNYAVDPMGRPTAITAKNPAAETLLSHAYTYTSGTTDTPLIFQDAYSQPGTASNTTTYEYDPLDRLKQATTTGTNASHYEYALDGVGNRTSQAVNIVGSTGGTKTYFRYNSGNELECRMKTNEACSKASTSEISGYSYDGAGNETAITGFNDPASTSFAYNNLSQLKSLTPPSSSEQALSYLGSGQNNLTAVGATSLQNSALGVTKQVNASGTSYYARTPGGLMVDERLPASANYNPIYDSQGDVVGLLNGSGALVQTVRYGPFGENSNSAGSLAFNATNDPFSFQGGYHMSGGNAGSGNVANSLYHFGERYYDPTSGRWTQQDPAGGVGTYNFVSADPINMSDPSGEMGMAGSEKTAAESTVRWCAHHPSQFYHNQDIYHRCEHAAAVLKPSNGLGNICHAAPILGLTGAIVGGAGLTVTELLVSIACNGR